jgi:hypothetical protein
MEERVEVSRVVSNGYVKSEPIMQKGVSVIPMVVAKIPTFVLA